MNVGQITFSPGYCASCGIQYIGTHYCALHRATEMGCNTLKHLTEDDVRRIIREELQRAGLGKPADEVKP